ncbi:MAG: M6 family metalloprotease domain-containing protein [Bacteroidetes bacterium]|nr:M6 family metalloprotease domain-containing protein [Bacteroidota bacterium]
MKKILPLFYAFFLLLQIINLSQNLKAVPAYPHPIEFAQPDGSVITIQLKGDEKVNWAVTLDGYTILSTKEGEYQYAILNEDGDLTFSGVKVSSLEKRTYEEAYFLKSLPKGLFYSDSQVEMLTSVWEMKDNAAKAFPTTGNRKLFCVLMQTPDISFTKTKAEFEALFNQLNYTVGGATGSVKDYYLENSYGQLTLTTDVFGPYTASQNMANYASDARPLVTQGVQAANAAANFADYDNDGDGWVDGVYMIFAGYGQEAGGGSGTIWSHAWSISPIQLDGKWISRYACSPELRSNSGSNITRIGVIGHEFGHVLGAPDYYDTNYETGGQFTGTGQWDMMAGGSWNNGGATPAHHNGFTKVYFYNWASPTILNSAATITLKNVAEFSDSFYRYNTATSGEYFFLENREKHKFDAYIPGSGLIIYHVHSGVMTSSNNNTVNTTHPQRMYPVAQNATMDPASDPDSYGTINAANCAWIGTSGKTSFTDATLPSSKSWAGANTAKPITNILRNAGAKTVTLNFMGGSIPANVVTFNVSDQYGNKIQNAQITVAKTSKNENVISNRVESENNTPIKSDIFSVQKAEKEVTLPENKNEKGTWIHWDSGDYDNAIGLTGGGTLTIASRWEPSDISSYSGMEITKIRAYVNTLPSNATLKIWQGANQSSLTEVRSQVFTATESSWNEITLSSPYTINAFQELWFGVIYVHANGTHPAGIDPGPAIVGKGDKAKINDGDWVNLADYGFGNWLLQAFLEGSQTIILYTDANGQASFEADLASYSYDAAKTGYTSASGNFTVTGATTTVNIILQNQSTTAPVVTTGSITNIGSTTATGAGNATSDGGSAITVKGVAYATTQNPTTANSTAPGGIGTGSFTANMTGLTPGTLYYVRAYATNANGTSYGNQVSFTTYAPPTVTTSSVTSITTTTATAGGNVTADGGGTVTARGVAYATTQNPTTSNSVVYSGTGTGSFTAPLSGLTAGTTYYVRAFATNTYGTTYGNQVSFTTTSPLYPPTVTTADISNITMNSANAGGNVTESGGATVTSRGVVYATTQNPTTSNSSVSGGSGTGSFNVTLSSLNPNTTYYVRAFAVNSQGTSYGAQKWFTTAEDNTSIADNDDKKNIEVFPNPAKDIVNITSRNNIIDIKVFDIFGNLVYSASKDGSSDDHQINISDFAAGIYFVQLRNVDGLFTSKLQILK